MRLTIEQRLVALERDTVVLHDTMTLLHKLLKEQRQLINDYIVRKVTSASESTIRNADQRPEDAVYAFVCSQRFEEIEKRMERIRKSVETSNSN